MILDCEAYNSGPQPSILALIEEIGHGVIT